MYIYMHMYYMRIFLCFDLLAKRFLVFNFIVVLFCLSGCSLRYRAQKQKHVRTS